MNVTIDGIEYAPIAQRLVRDHKFPELMAAIRNAIGYTLDDAAKHIGCAKSHLWSMENGKAEPSLKMAGNISRAYGLTLESLDASLTERTK